MRKLIIILFSLVSFSALSQINPTNGTVSNKSYSPAQAVTTDFRSWYYDGVNFIMRDYNGTSEVLSYINLSKYRSGHYPIYVHSGGSLGSNGVWTGGSTLVYWFKDGTANGDLIRWYTDSTIITPKVDTVYKKNDSVIGFTINQGPERTFIIRGVAGAGSISSLVLNTPSSLFNNPVNFANVSTAWSGNLTLNNQNANSFFAGPSIGGAAQPGFRQLVAADLPTGIPNGNLANSSIGLGIGTSGSSPNWGSSSASLGGTATLNIPILSVSNTGTPTPTMFNFWNAKVDSTIMSNDSVYEFRNGTRFFRYFITGSGGGGVSTFIFTNGGGFTGTVLTPGTTPTLSLAPSFTGLTFSNGTTFGAATVSSPLTYSGGTLGIQNGNTSQNGAITSTDWNTFNGKQAALSGTGYLKFSGTTPSYQTPTQVTADLNLFTTSLQGLVPASGGGTVNFLRADGTWTTPGGGGTVTSVAATVPSSLLTISGSPITGAGTLAFGLATQTSYTGFGNWTGSTAAPTFGKIPYQAFATGTANGILGFDGSGNPTILAPDTLFVKNRILGAGVIQIGNISNDTVYLNGLRQGTNITLTHNADSTITITSSGGFADPLTTNGDIIARIAGVTTRLAQGSNNTFLGVSGGALGYFAPFTLTTTGTSGAATFSAGTLNIPQYSGGGGSFVDSIYRTPGKDSIQFTIAGRYHSIRDSLGSGGGSQSLQQVTAVGNITTISIIDSANLQADSAISRSSLIRGPVQIGDTTFGAATRQVYTNGASVSLGFSALPSSITNGFGGLICSTYNFIQIQKGVSTTSTCQYAPTDSSLESRIPQAPVFNINNHAYYIITVGDGDTTTSQSFWNLHLGNVIDTLHLGRGWPLNRIIVLSPIYRLGNPTSYQNYTAWSALLSVTKGFKYGDIYHLMQGYYNTYVPGDPFHQSPISGDSLHPSTFGHIIIFKKASHLLTEEDMAGNLIVMQNATIVKNTTIGGTLGVTGITTLIGGMQNPANNTPMNYYSSHFGASNDYSGIRFMPEIGSSYTDTFSLRYFATSVTNRAGFAIYNNTTPVIWYNQGIVVFGSVTQAAGFQYTFANGGVFFNGNGFINGQLRVTGSASGTPQQILLAAQRSLNTFRCGLGVDASNSINIFQSDNTGHGNLSIIAAADTTTITSALQWWNNLSVSIRGTSIVPFPYCFKPNGNVNIVGFLRDSSFTYLEDTTGAAKRISYNSNIHSTYTLYTHIDRAWYDSVTAVRIAAGGGITRIAPLDSLAKDAKGIQVSGISLVPQSADGSFAGLVTTATQTFGGTKTFTLAPIFTTTSTIGQVWTASGTVGQGGWSTVSNIYTTDGTLTGARTVTQSGNTLTIAGGQIVLGASATRTWNPNAAITGSILSIQVGTLNDATTAASGTVTDAILNGVTSGLLTATNASVTYTNAYGFYVNGAPGASTNVTITNGYAFGVGGTSAFLGNVYLPHSIYRSNTPGIAAGTGAGTSPTVSISGTDVDGDVTVTTGTTPSGTNATIATITFASAYSYPNHVYPIITPANAITAALSGTSMIYSTGGTSTWVITSGTLALTAATTYVWHYHIAGN